MTNYELGGFGENSYLFAGMRDFRMIRYVGFWFTQRSPRQYSLLHCFSVIHVV